MMSKRTLLFHIVPFVLLFIGIRVVWIVVEQPPDTPAAIRGELDLRESNLNNDRTVSLGGEWEFYPNRFLMEKANRTDISEEGNKFIQVPGNWGHSLSPLNDSNYGYATYRLRILVDPDDERLFSIRAKGIASSAELYVNGRMLASSSRSVGSVLYSTAFASKDGRIDIVIQAANYVNSQVGGIFDSVKFGTERAVSGEKQFSFAMQFMVLVVLAMHALYAMLIYTFGARQKVLLSFTLLVLSAMFLVLADDDKLLRQWISLSWDWTIKLQILSLAGIGIFMLKFTRELLLGHIPTRIYLPIQWLNTAAVLSVVLLPSSILLLTSSCVEVMMLLSILVLLVLTIRLVLSGVEDAIFLLFGVIAVILSSLGGIVKNLGWFEMGFYPIDLLIAFLSSASFWFKRYIRAAAQTAILSEKLQREDKRKDDFLANVSHELRNPLHGILNIAQSVLDSEKNVLGEKNVQNLDLLVTVGRRMSFMLNDLLDLTLLKEKGIQLQVKAIHVQTVVSGVIDMLRFMTDGKRIRFDNHIPKWFPLVMADESRLIQILFNLLHNAVKYTNEGVITVRAHAEGGQATIFVQDTGIGMEDEQQRKIFEPYEQIDSGMTGGGNGIGLGLSICKQLVELHGGMIKVHSVADIGSTFFFTMKLSSDSSTYWLENDQKEKPETADTADSEAAAASAATNDFREMMRKPLFKDDGDGPTILIVDDDSVNLMVLDNILTVEGCKVVTASSGQEALSVLDSREWDLIISDVMMPNMSGYELTRLIRERFTMSELPILLLTARSRPEDLQTGFLSGANDYVTKPMNAAELKTRVRALTELKHSVRDQLRMEAAWLQAQIKPHFLFNTLNSIAALGDFDTTRMRSLLDVFGRYLKASFDFRNSERLVSLEQELQLVQSYLYIEKERFEDRLQIRWDVDESLMLYIPPLTIQTLVENAVRHGILKRTHGGEIQIRVARIPGGAEVAIIDNGVGMDANAVEKWLEGSSNPTTGIGLRNTDRRLKQIYGKGLQIQSQPDQGTTVAFRIREKIFPSLFDTSSKEMKE
ncbi:sensor histidine kinase YesM [Paenibacillus baekrokdamisoli]|nr:ATP-binding protein [Paenibacillus baekrokdamisoli]MBB3067772.1 sensor histidine kinase YesM [Paenibacillus baekrokdamisoli]